MNKQWDKFWFQPQTAYSVALFRIVFGFLLFLDCCAHFPDLAMWFGPEGIIRTETMQSYLKFPRLSLLYLFPPSFIYVQALFFTMWTCTVLLILGFQTRLVSIILFVCVASFHHRNTLILSSADTLARLISFFLIFTHAGNHLSIDSWLSKKRHLVAPWGQRMIQIQFCLVYIATWVHKMSGEAWIKGTALYYVTRLEQFWKFRIPYVFEHMWSIKLITWSTLFIEFGLGVLIWNTAFRWPVILAGLGLHLGIEMTMTLHMFEWLMISCLLLFLTESESKKVHEFLKGLLNWRRAKR